MAVVAVFVDFVGAAGLFKAEGVLSFVGCVDGDEIGVGVDYVILGVVQVAACVFCERGYELGAQDLGGAVGACPAVQFFDCVGGQGQLTVGSQDVGAWVVDVEARGHVGWGQDVFQPYVAVDISVDVAVASVLHGVADGGVGQVGYLEPGGAGVVYAAYLDAGEVLDVGIVHDVFRVGVQVAGGVEP